MTSKQTHNRTREDAKTLCALSFCAYTEREKETTSTQEQTKQARGQAKDNKGKAPEDRQRDRKTKVKR